MNFINSIKEVAKGEIKKIVLPEAYDIRTLKAAYIATSEGYASIILIGDKNKISIIANDNDIDINNIEIIDPNNSSVTNTLIDKFYEIRKHKGITITDAKDIITNNFLYFGAMLVKCDFADGMVAGAVNTSSDLLRAALQTVKTNKNIKTASAFFLMDVPNSKFGSDGVFIFADSGMNQNPTSEQLAEIAYTSSKSFEILVNKVPYVAMLSHSTFGSGGNHEDILKVREALAIAKRDHNDLLIDGELQLDAAIVPDIAATKAANSLVAGRANVLVFPDLDAGNIGYKLVQRLANADAYGPITQGLAKPINDLSRGCSSDDIAGVIAITVVQAINNN